MAQRGKQHLNEKLVLALACGATVEAVAQATGIHKRTVYRRLEDPAFQEQVRQVRDQMVQRTSGMLTAAGGEAIKTLMALMKENVPPAVRLGASRSVIELSLKVRAQAELEQRLAALEEQMLGERKRA